jgi:hypothetical protein
MYDVVCLNNIFIVNNVGVCTSCYAYLHEFSNEVSV